MSKIIITGSAIVLKSGLELDTLKKLAKYKPGAMEARDEKDRLVFKVAIAGEGEGSVSEKAIYFAPVTHDADGLATVTLGILWRPRWLAPLTRWMPPRPRCWRTLPSSNLCATPVLRLPSPSVKRGHPNTSTQNQF